MDKPKVDYELLLGCKLKNVPKNRPFVSINPHNKNPEHQNKYSVLELYDENISQPSRCHRYTVHLYETEYVMILSKECPCKSEAENTCFVTSSYPPKKFVVDEDVENLRDVMIRFLGSLETTLLRIFDNDKEKVRKSKSFTAKEQHCLDFTLAAGALFRYAVHSNVVGTKWVFALTNAGDFGIFHFSSYHKKWTKIDARQKYTIQKQQNRTSGGGTKALEEMIIDYDGYIMPCESGDAFLITSYSNTKNSGYDVDDKILQVLSEMKEVTSASHITDKLATLKQTLLSTKKFCLFASFLVPCDEESINPLNRQISSVTALSQNILDSLSNIEIPKFPFEDLDPPQTFQPISVVVAEKKTEVIVIIKTIVSGELSVNEEKDFILLNVVRSQDKYVGSSYSNDNYTATSVKELSESYRRTILLPAMIDKESRKTSYTNSGMIVLKYKKIVK